MTAATLTDIPFVHCKKEVNYCRTLHTSMSDMDYLEPPEKVIFLVRLLGNPFSNVHLLQGECLCTWISKSEIVRGPRRGAS